LHHEQLTLAVGYLTHTGVIRPVLVYAAPVWNHLLSKTQIDQIEAIQRRALRIIYSYTNDMPYINASIPSLVDRREQLSRKFFTSLLQPSSCLHTLLPTPRDPTITTRLRSANKFPRLPSHTRKYQTFIMAALCNRGAIIFLPCSFFLSSSIFFSLPNLSGHRLDVYHTSTHGVALVRI